MVLPFYNKMIFIIRMKREKEMSNDVKIKWQIAAAVFMCVVGAGLLIASFIVPPLGEIHPSILAALGEVLTFAGALLGISANYKIKVGEYIAQHGNQPTKDE